LTASKAIDPTTVTGIGPVKARPYGVGRPVPG
jgi:hypothetical protein